MTKFKYLGMTITLQSFTHEEINSTYNLQNTVVTTCTTCFNTKNSAFCPQSVFIGFLQFLRIKADCFLKQH
jgi:hypothetical protein